MVSTFTARYIKTDSGYMGQIIEWPEVVTKGVDPQDAARPPAPPTGG
jgi:predicted RNase H-like HicB family nuclease